ncbi:hypothetical protein BIW11_12973 [Tropilaelaps mercedesae]|uniref:Uncharacterized protein n=1 Tax=Tropilaelaps mercedesae TaxID=418985 RepID=A0A1V9X4D4_9ACAR|nr:hypothetical protein BIW11_12973 [Tropilaelaps mercedesae]
MATNATARISIASDRPPAEVSPSNNTRRTYVTCDSRTSLATNIVLTSIASFLRDKVFPIVGDNCRINLHWDGVDLSSLHIQSVIPDNCILVPRTTSSGENSLGRTWTSAGAIFRSAGDATPPSSVTTLNTHNIPNGGVPTVKRELLSREATKGGRDECPKNGPTTLNGSENGKLVSEPRIIITRNGDSNFSGTLSLLNSGKQLPSIRAKPTTDQPSPLLLPTPPDMTSHPLCIPQTTPAQSIFPLLPVVTYLQPQVTLGQVNAHPSATLVSSGMPITQVQPFQTLHQVSTPACTGQIINSSQTQTYTMQPVAMSLPSPPVRTQMRPVGRVTTSNGRNSLIRKVIRNPAHQSIKSEPMVVRSTGSSISTAAKQVRITPKQYRTPLGSQILIKGGKVLLKSPGQVSCKKLSPEGQDGCHKLDADNATTRRTKSPRVTRVSIVAHGQDDEPPIVYPALGSQPLEKLFDTL